MFDLSKHIIRLIDDIAKKVPVFCHIETKNLLMSCAEARGNGKTGIWAQLYPMKYENGHYSIRQRVGNQIHLYKTDKLRVGRSEILYIIYLMMPRFQNLSYFQKLETIFHELYHISPEFDGRLRYIHPRYIFHGPSLKMYDKTIRYWVRYYLNHKPNSYVTDFLNYSYHQLEEKYGSIEKLYIPEPRETRKVMVSRDKTPRKKRKKKWRFVRKS